MKKSFAFILAFLITTITFFSCKKYLDEKSNQKLVVPESLTDLQALLDFYSRVSQFNPSAAEKSSDDFYLTDADFSAITTETDRRTYTWEKDFLFSRGVNDWSLTYDNVYRANVVLNHIDQVSVPHNQADAWKNTKGHAYFIRASSFFKAAIIWSPAYDPASAGEGLGIPLRLDPDFNKPSVRSSVHNTYNQIVSDLEQAIQLLPIIPLHPIRPSKPTAYALVARTFLAMQKYDMVVLYADSCLQFKNTLLDLNPPINPNAGFPVPRFNQEVVIDMYMNTPSMLVNTRAKIDSVLYNSYHINDLRKTVFFRSNNNGTYGFKGGFSGLPNLFDGITVGEVYLMRAEALARTGKTNEAMDDLNKLLIKRWKAGTFSPFTAVNPADALQKILLERRKELLMRGLRWMDLKRLNREGANITISRFLNNQLIQLPPNDNRYALPIPEDVIELSGMKQNPR